VNLTSVTGRRRPRLLVCQDLQQASVPEGEPQASVHVRHVIGNCRRILNHARAWDWSIIHIHRRHASAGDHPLEGLAPRLSEPVMARRGLSAFSNRSFRELVGGAPQAQIVLIGFCLASSCLATLLVAHDFGLFTLLVEDAVSTGAETEGGRIEVLARSIAAPFSAITLTDELIGRRPAPRLVVG
jgi:nicotinamidase-related amidase